MNIKHWAAKGIMMLSACALLCLSGCAGSDGPNSSASSSGQPDAEVHTVRVGTMPTEDILPLWVAEHDGMTAEDGTKVEVITFDSAQALSAAIASGDVDMAMTDIMRAAKLTESGTAVTLEWITLGETSKEGRFGVLALKDAPYNNLEELAAYIADSDVSDIGGVGVGANTVPEYVFDMLSAQANVTIPTEEVASLPERYSLIASGQLLAAALPASLLALGEATDMKVIADDTQGENISQSIMIARTDWANEHPQAVLDVAELWDGGAKAVAAEPGAYRTLLAEKANLNSSIASTYSISSYPYALRSDELAHPSADLVKPVLAWMAEKGYGGAVTYNETTGEMSASS